MKRQNLLVFTYFLGSCALLIGLSEPIDSSKPTHEVALQFVNMVQKRYYVIRRLEGAVDRLLTQYMALCGKSGGKECQECAQGERGCSLEKELAAVKQAWQDCLSYKHIMGDAHVKKMLVHIIVLYEALLKVCGASAVTSLFLHDHILGERVKTLTLEQLDLLLDTVDVLSAKSQRYVHYDKPQVLSTLLFTVFSDDTLFSSVQECDDEPCDEMLSVLDEKAKQNDFLINTTVRFYVIHRLSSALEQLVMLSKKVEVKALQAVDPELFTSPSVKECLRALQREKSLMPLRKLWEDVRSYRYIGDTSLVKELLLLVIQLYKVVMKTLAPSQEQAEVSEYEVVDLYSTIASLPLSDLLIILDELHQQSNAFMYVYQESAAQGWREVVKRYWWAPPVVVAGCVSLYFRMKKFVTHPIYRMGKKLPSYTACECSH